MNDTTTDRYRHEGWCLQRELIPAPFITAARDTLNALLADPGQYPDKHYQYIDPAKLQHPTAPAVPGGIQRPMQLHDSFRAIAEHPALVAAMEALLGGPVVLFTDQIGVKHGDITDEQGGRSYYHQDSWYWKLPPEVGCNCWIPLDDVGPDAISLAIMPGTQASWELDPHESYFDSPNWGRFTDGTFQPFKRHRIPLEVAEAHDGTEVLHTLAPGDGLFFTNYTWHRSEPNRSGQTKAFYAIAYKRA